MAANRNAPHPPPGSSSSEDVPSADEEEVQVAKESPLNLNNFTKRAQPNSNSQSESESEYDSEPEPESKSQNTQKASESHSSSSDDGEEEEEEEKSPAKKHESSSEEEEEEEGEEEEKSLAKKPESEPDKKKIKIAASSPSDVPTGNFKNRIWSSEDELALLQAFLDFHANNNRVPVRNDYDSILLSLAGKINHTITSNQVINKVRAIKYSYYATKNKGSEAYALLNPHAKVLFDLSNKLWCDVPMKQSEPSQVASYQDASVGEVRQLNLNHGTINGDTNMKRECEYPYLIEVMKEISGSNPGLSVFYKNSYESMDEGKRTMFESRLRKIKYNEARLQSDKIKIVNSLSKVLVTLGK